MSVGKVCPKCGTDYAVCDCGTGHYHGSSNAEHYLSCKLSNLPEGMTGLFKPNDGIHFPPWEAPNGECPHCWHLENPDKKKVELSEFGENAKAGIAYKTSES